MLSSFAEDQRLWHLIHLSDHSVRETQQPLAPILHRYITIEFHAVALALTSVTLDAYRDVIVDAVIFAVTIFLYLDAFSEFLPTGNDDDDFRELHGHSPFHLLSGDPAASNLSITTRGFEQKVNKCDYSQPCL